MLAEIITFVGIVCAGVLTQGEAGKELKECIDQHRFTPGNHSKECHPNPLPQHDLAAAFWSLAYPDLWLLLPGVSQVSGHKMPTCWC